MLYLLSQKTSANVTFVMSGLLAGSSPKLVHKCELLVRLERDIEPVLVCSKWLTTYYGAFEFPCDFEGMSTIYWPELKFALIISPNTMDYSPWSKAKNDKLWP